MRQASINRAAIADMAECRAAIQKGSRSFYAASLLLPNDVREAAYALYAFCRYSDDFIDVGGGDARAISKLRDRLDDVYRGRPRRSAFDRALARAAETHAIPKLHPSALLEGLAWDAAGRRYQTVDDLFDYAARVAGSVGAMMAVVMGACEKEALARACDLGVAMQLTNIARDLGEDARAGRIYYPLDWFFEAGIDPDAWLQKPACTPTVREMTRRMLDIADGFYARGETGIDFLPPDCRAGIVAAARIYSAIGDAIRANGDDSVSSRAFVSTRRKLTILAGALAAPNFSCASPRDQPLAANAFLIDAVKSRAGRRGDQSDAPGRVLDMFLKLERRERQFMIAK